jgi:hypothetical protein
MSRPLKNAKNCQQVGPFDLQEALRAGDKITDAYYHAARTTAHYKGNIKRAREFLATQIEEGRLPQEFQTAFDDVKEFTPAALYAFVSYLCNNKQFSYKTAEGIRSAFKNHFDEKGFKGEDWRETSPGVWQGNPVFEHKFVKLMKSLRNQEGRAGSSRQSLPMLYLDMTKLMAYLQDQKTIDRHGVGACLMFQAFAATGFMLWTR